MVTKGNLSHINGQRWWCNGSATTSNTTYIFVDGNGAGDTLVIDLSGGDFEPSNDTPDGYDDDQNGIEGKNDIEFVLYEVENVSVLGNASDDKITIGDGRTKHSQSARRRTLRVFGFINLNDDDDADVWDANSSNCDSQAWIWGQVAEGYGSVSVDGAGGDDEISAKGDHGTGPAVGTCGEDEVGVCASGSAGNDDIQGGEGNDCALWRCRR